MSLKELLSQEDAGEYWISLGHMVAMKRHHISKHNKLMAKKRNQISSRDDSTPDLSDLKMPMTTINEESTFTVFYYEDDLEWNQEHSISAGSSASEKSFTSFQDISEQMEKFDLHPSEMDKEGMVARPKRSKSVESKSDLLIGDISEEERLQKKEQNIMFNHIIQRVPSMAKILKSVDDLTFKRLNGNSNACFKVSIKDGLYPEETEVRSLLYRRYEQDIIDKKIEQAIFSAMSADGSGPKMYY